MVLMGGRPGDALWSASVGSHISRGGFGSGGSDPLTLILNYDYATQDGASASGGKAKWQGLAGYVNYQLSEQWRLSVRAEYFDDKDGYRTGVIQKWKEATATLAYLPNKNLELRAEVRGDRSDRQAFLKSDRVTPDRTERSLGVEALYKF